ncbi:MAG: twin-arginine translocase subunit TatC, partial [Candidatus Latescibacterota bacterium]
MRPIKKSAKEKEILREMSFLEHLDDLRGVLIQSVIAFLLAMIVCWFFSGRIIDLLIQDLTVEQLIFYAPAEAFMARVKISLVLGLLIVYPFVLFRIWSFVSPALFDQERKKVWPFVVAASILFYVGVVFAYLILIPIALGFLIGFGTENLTPMISVTSYFAFVARLCLVFGIVFQLPIIVFVLSMIGVVTPRFLLGQWRYAVLIIFVAAAILTPPDPASQVLMALPILLLY